jgi:predicted ATPase/DNA-binding SARP family transcriptional activator
MTGVSANTAASALLRIYILGRFRIEGDSGSIRLPRRKVEVLLAYLLLHPEEHSREKLAALCWGDSPDARARQSLRTALNVLRKKLGQEIILADREVVQFNPSYPRWVDALEFLAQATQFLSEPTPNPDAVNIHLYQGDLLVGFYGDWILEERERYHRLYVDTLLRLTQELRSCSDYERAIEFARQILDSEPTNESAHQHLMFCFVATGDRNAALAQYEVCRRALHTELDVEPMPETTALYHWIRQRAPEGRASAAHITNLPISWTSFIGRKRELTEAKKLLSHGDALRQKTRLLTLTGAGGTGKTRLAIQVATDLVDVFKDGVWWVDLAPLLDATLVPQAVAKALAIREVPNWTLSQSLLDFLRDRQLLLVLDNCEHLILACSQLAVELLGKCPDVSILATSRESLGVTGEVVRHVPTLSLPDPQQSLPIQALMEYEGIRLFVERATAARQDFSLSPHNASTVAAVCRQLDGIPLAIELAAARVKVMSVEQIATRLDDRFSLLKHGSRTALARQQTLRATIDWSYKLLTEPEKALFRRLSVFAGGFTLAAAEAICADAKTGEMALTSASVLDFLSQLASKSLVEVDQEPRARYRLLDTIRQYAREELLQSGESEQVQHRHFAFFLGLAQDAEPKLRGSDQLAWTDWFKSEHDNLRGALAWSLDGGELEKGLRLASAMAEFWWRVGNPSEGVEWLNRMLSANKPTSDRTRAEAMVQAARMELARGDYERASALSKQSLVLWRDLDGKKGIAQALRILGVMTHFSGDRNQAIALLEESLAIFRETEDEWDIGSNLVWLADTCMRAGDYHQAAALFEESLTLFRKLGDRWGIGFALGGAGDVARLRGNYSQATMFFQESLALHYEEARKADIPYLLEALANLAAMQGRSERAARLWGASESLRSAVGASLPPSYQIDYAPHMNAARAEMGETAFAAAWARGKVMPLDQSMAYALDKTSP